MDDRPTDALREPDPASRRTFGLTRADLVEAHRHALSASLRRPRLRAAGLPLDCRDIVSGSSPG
ncbi:MAG: hypothetical protein PGN34_00310 [Methylobacterium frigidaeris]